MFECVRNVDLCNVSSARSETIYMTRRRHLTRRRHAPRRIPQLLKIFCLCSTATGVFSLSDLSANLRSHEDSAPLLTMLLNVFADSDAPKEAPTLSGGSNSPLKRPASPALPAPRPPSAEPVAPRRALGLASLAFLSNLAYGVTSFGSALVFHTGFKMLKMLGLEGLGGVREATGHIVTFMFITRAAQAWHLRLHRLPRLVLLLCGVMLPTVLVGVALSTTALCNEGLELVLGWSLLIVVILKLKKGVAALPPPLIAALRVPTATEQQEQRQQQRQQQQQLSSPETGDGLAPPTDLCFSRQQVGWIGAAGAASGLLTGLVGIPGPPMMVLLSFAVAIDPLHWRATSALVNWATNLLQLAALAFFARLESDSPTAPRKHCGGGGEDGGSGDARSDEQQQQQQQQQQQRRWLGGFGYEDVLMVVGALAGLWIGNRVALSPSFSSGAALQRGILVFLVLGAVSMLTAGVDSQLFQLTASAVAAIACAIFITLQSREEKRLRQHGQRRQLEEEKSGVEFFIEEKGECQFCAAESAS
jgi:uncharacterized membrane protein YfcA